MFYPKLAWQNIKNNRQFYLPYIFASIFTVMMFFMMVNFTHNDSLKNSTGGDNAIQVMGLGSTIIGIFAVIFLFYSNSFLIKRRKKEFGLYNILGMEKKHISRILFFETIYIFLINIIVGISLGLLFFRLIHLMLLKIMRFNVSLGFEFHIEPVTMTIIMFAIISTLIYLNSIRQVYVSNPVELLRGGQVGEKEPKSKWILAILGTLFLGTGYYLALTAKDAFDALMMFFVAVVCVIIGTYLLFTTGSIVILKSLRKNKRLYYKIDNFTAISGMIYRMKQNAMGLGNIAILSTMTIIVISGSVSLYLGINNIMDERYPNDIQIKYSDIEKAPSRDDLYNTIQDTLKEENRTMSDFRQYDYLNITVTNTQNGVTIKNISTDNITTSYLPEDVSILSVITLDDYNAMTNQNQVLTDDQMLMFTKGYDIPNTFNIDDTQYSVKSLDSFPIDAGYYNMTKVSEIYIVVKNHSQLEDLYNKQLDVFDTPSELQYNVYFNLDGTDDEKISFANALIEKVKIPSKTYHLGDIEVDTDTITYISPVDCKVQSINSCYSMFGSLLFLGIFLGVTFLMATGLIIYYKQLSEGYEDKQRFNIMQKVGLSKSEIKKTIHTQIMMVFFLPLITAIIHTAFAFPMLKLILSCFSLTNVKLFLICTLSCIIIFAIIYALIYSVTAKIYYKIVS